MSLIAPPISAMSGPVRSRRRGVVRTIAARVVGLLAALAARFLLLPAGASASVCTNTWTGGSEGAWQTAGNWSAGHTPTSSDVACIGSGTTVKVGEGTNQASVLEDEGTLVIREASLELVDVLEASSVKSLTMEYGAKLTGAATLDLSGTLSWTGESKMSGTGSTVLGSGATGTIETTAHLSSRTLVNEGTLTLASGSLGMFEGAVLKNSGTFDENAQEFSGLYVEEGKGVAPLFVNTGTFQKTEGTGESYVEVDFENLSTVHAKTGRLVFRKEGVSVVLAGGSVLEGAIVFEKVSVTAGSFSSPNGSVTLAGGPLTISSGATASISDFVMKYQANLTGPGTLDLPGTFSWALQSTMSGTGSTVLESGATGSINSNADGTLAERTFVNEGTFVLENGVLTESEGAKFENKGTFDANAEDIFGINFGEKGAAPSFVNAGTFQKTEGTGETYVEVDFENKSTVHAKTGKLAFLKEGVNVTLASGSVLEGAIRFEHVNVTAGSFSSPNGSVTLERGPLTISSGATASISDFIMNYEANVAGAGTLDLPGTFSWSKESKMSGAGSTVIPMGASASVSTGGGHAKVAGRTLINEGTFTLGEGLMILSEGGRVENTGTFDANETGEAISTLEGSTGLFVNAGTFQKTSGTGTTVVEPNFENLGSIAETSGKLEFKHPVTAEPSTQFGPSNPSAPGQERPSCGDPVDCATGNYSESQTDLSVGGRGVGLVLTRTYNAQAAAAGTTGVFGYGWSSFFSDHVVLEKASQRATLVQGNGSTVVFAEGKAGSFSGPAWTQDTLSGTPETGYTLTLPDQTKYQFEGATGRLQSVTDRNGNATTVAYESHGRIETITDPAGRKITFAYNSEGLVESAKDPLGHTVKYTYEAGSLASVTEPGGTGARWQFKYDGSHEITTMTDSRGGKTSNEYDSSHRVISQTDPAERTLTFEYEAFHTKITNKATGAVTDERFTSADLPFSITHGAGTTSASTETYTYDAANNLKSVTDGNGHTTKYTYDGSSNRTSMVDADEHETKWTYDATHDVETMTTPGGETTTIKRNTHGDPETISRPAPGKTTQTTKYEYDTHGNLTSVTDPLERTWKYEYDTAGDRTGETDPEGDKRTWGYNEDSQLTSTVSPRGNVKGAKATEFTTKTERDAQGRPTVVTDPLGHTTKYTYDGDGNLETLTDGNGHKTTYTYDADNEPTIVKKPNGAVTETGYDSAGQVTSQTDGNKHTTKYVRNILEQVTEVVDPLGHKTTKEYDAGGNLKSLTDPAKRTTTYNTTRQIASKKSATPTGKHPTSPTNTTSTATARTCTTAPAKQTTTTTSSIALQRPSTVMSILSNTNTISPTS